MAANVSAAQYLQNADALDRLVASLKAKIGVFLENSQDIINIRDRANALAKSATGQAQAAAKILSAKGTALLSAQTNLEKVAQDLLGAASALKDSVQSPLYSFLSTNPMMWGTRQFQILGDLASKTNTLFSNGTNLATAISHQNDDVKTYSNEVRDTESAAAGVGVIPKINTVLSGVVSSVASPLTGLMWPLAIAAVGGVVLYGASTGLFTRRRK